MKYFKTLTKISLLSAIILMSACSSTNYLTMTVTEPAPVTIPANIKTVGIIDRSIAGEKMETLNKIEQVLSVEGKNLDKDGAKETLTGVYDELKNLNLFSDVKIINDTSVKSPGTGIAAAPLSWNTVAEICDKNNADVLFELFLFDTNTLIDYKAVPVTVDGPLGVKVNAVESRATVRTKIKTGWRIYDNVNKIIRDEYYLNDVVVSRGSGINPLKAVQAIIGRREAVLQVGSSIGHNYVLRILPVKIRVSRDYYVRGTDNFKVAKRRAQTGDWNGAADLWYKETTNPKRKIAGRAYYNMAIINEINGDLNAAIDWASQAYSDFNNKLALRYLNILKNRAQDQNLLDEQQNGNGQ